MVKLYTARSCWLQSCSWNSRVNGVGRSEVLRMDSRLTCSSPSPMCDHGHRLINPRAHLDNETFAIMHTHHKPLSIPASNRIAQAHARSNSSRCVVVRSKSCDVAIVGGGLGGLALASYLGRTGYNFNLFEAAPELRTSTSTMIGLGKSAETCLTALHPEIVPELKACGSKCRIFSNTVGASRDQQVMTQRIPDLGRYTVRWSEIQRVIASHVPPAAVNCGYRAVGYTEDKESGLIRVHFKDREDVHARLVIAADGLRSAIRSTLYPQDPGPRYLGQMNWNMLLYNPGGSVVAAHEPDESISFMNYVENDKRTLSSVVSDAGGGYTFIAVAKRSEVPDFTSTPVGGKGCPGVKTRVLKMLEVVGWEIPYKCVEATPESEIFERAIMDRVPLDELGATMTSPGGRVVLLGDAAHAMHPGPGQGGRTAFEDAHTLMQLLEQHRDGLVNWDFSGRSGQDVVGGDAEALSQIASGYNKLRMARTCRVQRFSAEGCGLAAIRDACTPMDAPTTAQLQIQRGIEFLKWMDQYPDNSDGDPESMYWKPVKVKEYVQVASS